MHKFRDLMEAKDTIVFAFGRFNPPTTGHEKLIQKTAQVAGSNPYRIYPSFTTNPKKDPLPHALKVAYMRKMFSKYKRNIIADKDAKTAIMIAEKLFKEGFKNLIMVAGSDRVKEFSTLLNRYNDAPDKKGNQLFKFDSVEVISAGERDPDAEGVEGMSASKMRAAATNGDYDSFSMGIPATLSDADKKKLYRDVRKYMGIREERDMGDMSDFEAVRDAYLTGKIWNVGSIVEANGLSGEVVRKGTNYLSFMTEDGKVHKAWLHEINEAKSPLQKLKDFDKSRVAAGKKPIFTDKKPPKFVRMKKAGQMTIMNVPTDEIDKYEKKGYEIIEEVELDESKIPNDDLNWVATGGSFGKKRRFPTFVVKKEGNKYNAYDEQNKMSLKAGSNSLEGLAKMLKPYIEKRTGSWKFEEVELEERNYRKEYDNYQGRPEQIVRRSSRNKARRVMGDKTKIGMDVGHADNDPMNNDPDNLRNEDPSENRREPRLRKGVKIKGKVYKPGDKPPPGGWPKMTFGTKRMPKKEEVELDELWFDTVKAKLSQMTHPKGYGKMVKDYAELMKQDKYKKRPNMAADVVARTYSGVSVRELIKYINKLVAKKILPQELKAEYQREEWSFKNFVQQIQEGAYGYERQDPDIKDKEGTQPAKYHKGLSKSTKQKRDAHFKKKKEGPAPGDAEAETKPSVHTKKFKQMYGDALPKDADMGDYIDDFQKSDSPQFKGKSEKKRKEMAIAAFLSKNEQDDPCWDGYKQVGMKKKNGKEVPNCVPEEVDLNEKVEGLVNKSEKSGISYSILKKVYDRGLAAYKTGHRPGTTAPQWAFARVNSFITGGGARKSDNDLWKQHKEEFNEWGELEEASEYQGKKVTLNKPFYTPDGPKKSAVYVTGPKGDVVIVRFGDPDMKIKVNDPERRRSFRARHNCDNPGPKWKARYWSCKAW